MVSFLLDGGPLVRLSKWEQRKIYWTKQFRGWLCSQERLILSRSYTEWGGWSPEQDRGVEQQQIQEGVWIENGRWMVRKADSTVPVDEQHPLEPDTQSHFCCPLLASWAVLWASLLSPASSPFPFISMLSLAVNPDPCSPFLEKKKAQQRRPVIPTS